VVWFVKKSKRSMCRCERNKSSSCGSGYDSDNDSDCNSHLTRSVAFIFIGAMITNRSWNCDRK
jgi:hypothetical protein